VDRKSVGIGVICEAVGVVVVVLIVVLSTSGIDVEVVSGIPIFNMQ